MTLAKKINLFVCVALIVLSVCIIYTGTVVITKLTYQNISRIMALEISNILAKVTVAANTLQQAGVAGIENYVTAAQQELVKDFRNFRFGTTGKLFVIGKNNKVIFHDDFKEGEVFDSKFANDIIAKGSGSMNFDYKDKRRFCVFQNFPEWGWHIALSISEAELFSQRTLFLRTVSGITLIILLMTGALALFFTRSITTSLKTLTAAAGAISQKAGDLTQQVEINTKDEIGQLGRTFNQLIRSLLDIVKQIIQSTEKVNNLAQGLSASAQEMNASTQEVSHAIQQITQGITTQASRSEETAKTMASMATSVKQMAANAEQGSKASRENADFAQEGMAASQSAMESTDRVTVVAAEIEKVVSQLGERSQEIRQISEVITGIADQTNLLALNAAIEAARAGESGRGFAVVADEVRKLAENSAKQADRIGKLIRNIEQETTHAVDSVHLATKEVGDSRLIIEKVRKALDKILKAATLSAAQVQEISIAAVVQLKNTQEVNKAISEVASFAENSVSSTQMASSSIQEMSASMQEMTASAQTLAQVSADLKDLVSKFKVQ